jgi:geranylgeranyl reductase family protein
LSEPHSGVLVNTGGVTLRETLWDAVIVGAGPAGCAAAYDVAVAGHSALLLDKAEFPRHKACAGGLTRKSLRALRYPVTPVVRQTLSAITVEKSAAERSTIRSFTPVCAMTVREELDDFCLRQTLSAGVHFQRIGAITAIEESADSVSLLAGGEIFRGRFLIGADGVHSQVRRFAGDAAWFHSGFALEANVSVSRADLVDPVFDFAPVRGGYGWVFPKGDHVNVGLYTLGNSEKINRERLTAYIDGRFGPMTAHQLTGQYLGFGAGKNEPSLSRTFLVGDAGGFADPLTGEGIYGAIASGQAAALAMVSDLRGEETAFRAFAKATERLRADLRISTRGAYWFYQNMDKGYRALTAPVLRGAILRAYADGSSAGALAATVQHFANMFGTQKNL